MGVAEWSSGRAGQLTAEPGHVRCSSASPSLPLHMRVVAAVAFQLIPKQRAAADESKSGFHVARPGPPIYAQAANAAETDGHIHRVSFIVSPASSLPATAAALDPQIPQRVASGQRPAGSARLGRATGRREGGPQIDECHYKPRRRGLCPSRSNHC